MSPTDFKNMTETEWLSLRGIDDGMTERVKTIQEVERMKADMIREQNARLNKKW